MLGELERRIVENSPTRVSLTQDENDEAMPFLDHVKELRRKLIVSFLAIVVVSVVCFCFYSPIISFLYRPFAALNRSPEGKLLFINTVFEGFLIKIKVAFLAGIVLSSPLHTYNLVRFIFPALTAKGRRVFIYSIAASFFLAGFSIFYGYYKIIPISFGFLTSKGFIPPEVGMLLNFERNIFYVFRFLIIAIVLFQLPVILEITLAMNLVKRSRILKLSRFVVVGTFVLSALLTPPDFISQISLALPMTLLFFLTILVAKIFKFGED